MMRVLLILLMIFGAEYGSAYAGTCIQDCDDGPEENSATEKIKPFKLSYANSAFDKKFSLGKDIGFGLRFSHSLQKNFQKWGVVVSEDIVRLGEKAIKFETRESFCGFDKNNKWNDCKNGRNRHEFSSRYKDGKSVFPLNRDFWHALSIYIPGEPKFAIPVETGVFQFHGKPNVAWKFHYSDIRGFYLTNYIDPWQGKTFIKPDDFIDKWNDIVIQINHSIKPDGYLKVWINGELKFDYKGITTMHKGKPYFKFGIYNTAKPVGNPEFNDGANFNNIWVYFDEIRFAKSCQKLKLEDLGYDCEKLKQQ
ncbi:MAG TPA: hypothetical protein DEQ75_04995 [Alphaproteobacteria bacterium]|nr:hypothetical protein [Alphaproteobacteria bacterium]HCV63092.1 hypothetical protein [Alphaproteobacteria bacterium]|tara:strand:+ start:11369 stop:12292 length:924 start_codon:yes stop_codon:yes gene_type:complete